MAQTQTATDLNMIICELYARRNETHECLTQGTSFLKYCVAEHKQRKAEQNTTTDTVTKRVTKRLPWLKNNKVACCYTSINIVVLCMNTKCALQVETTDTIEEVCRRERIAIRNTWFSFGGKPLRLTTPLAEYGVCEGSTIIQNERLLGGSIEDPCRVYTHIFECEQQLLDEVFTLQAEDRIITTQNSGEVMDAAMKLLTNFKTLAGDNTWICDLLENFFQVAYWTRKCKTKADYITCVMLSYKLLTGKSVCSSIWKAFNLSQLQDDSFTKLTRDMRDMFSTASLLVNNPLLKKLRQVYTYLLVQGFLSHFGAEMGVEEYLKLDAKTKVQYKDKTSMVMLIIETAITICERIDAYRVTGDWHALVHDDATYMAWTKEAERLIALAPFTSNLAAHGTTYFTFVSDLSDTIEKGEAIAKYSQRTSGIESTVMRKRLASLQMLKNVEITRRASQKERKAPFGVLIHGGSSVAKSSFTKMLFYYYGRVHKLDVDDHFRYVRNPADEYWSNFDSSKWCIQMDDIAFLLPSKSADVDATLKEMLNVVNNVPYVPPQAALEDKGKTPVMAKLVLATTNAPDLNAQDYFHCPLAVRRRLPYVVHVKPKPEYLAENGKFIDPSKLPPIDKAFPNYWIIEVQKLVPVDHNGRDSAAFETVKVFSDVKEFLQHFARASVEHEKTQAASDVCDVAMRDIGVCSLCYNVSHECTCLQSALVVPIVQYIVSYFISYVTDILGRLLISFMCTWIYAWCARYYVVRATTAQYARIMNSEVELKVHSILNRTREFKFKIAVGTLVKIGLVMTSMLVCYKVSTMIVPTKRVTKTKIIRQRVRFSRKMKVDELDTGSTDESEVEEPENKTEEVSVDVDWEEQGNIHGTTEEQLQKEESRNVWYNPTIELSSFDVPTASQSLATLELPQVRDLFSKNCVRVEVHALDATFATRMGAVFLRGQYLCMNRHAFRLGTRFRLRISTTSAVSGVSPNIDCYVARSEFKEIVEKDIVVLRIANVPPRKDILKYWNVKDIPVSQMISVRRTTSGDVVYEPLYNVTFRNNFPVEALNVSMDVYLGVGTCETKVGDCGSLGIAVTPRGPVVLGLHTLGCRNTAAFPHVRRDELESLCTDPIGNIEGVGEPKLTLNGDNILVPPHHKSVFRYMQKGTANVYGCLPGARPKPRSRVCATPLQEIMVEHFGKPVCHGPPVMTGWEPVFNNVVEMVQPNTDIDQAILDHCVESYTHDIISGLDGLYGDAWKGELVFLSRRAAVNGLPGVKFIDRINTSTSMGHPWSVSKEQYLIEDWSEEYPDGVTFTDDVWDRVDEIEKTYAQGKRAFPVFTGHNKDEAVPFAKIAKKKTRLFTGAPIDWSLVVRSRLLSFVRLLQKNKFVFEAAPGTVTQSVEWTHFYHYLTKHGDDRIIAGDYGKFDKRMIATFVLSAFRIIANAYKAAGFSDEEVREIYCIGMDTAFPVTNINGDIIEFFGTNPSGQPLTVVVNSLVNSLYMRYAYCLLNPQGTNCTDFKRNINLITYGDDNAMGVSTEVPWFNHTAIQKAMATIGVEYTMADKEAESKPYIGISECSFLKREWRWEEELEMYVCPLDKESIHKSLTVWVPSRTIDRYKQMVEVIVSANNEYFFHGRDEFEQHHAFFKEVLAQHPYSAYVTETTLPGWDDLIARFRRASEGISPNQ